MPTGSVEGWRWPHRSPPRGRARRARIPLRQSALPESEANLLRPVLESFLRRHPDGDTAIIVRAAELATVAHAGQRRRSGEPYVTHPIAVAGIVADLGLDAQTVAAALLHDAVEDTGVTTEVIERDFGPAVALIVEGVTKLDRLQFDSKEAQQAATVRKMLVAMADDWRVLIIKLADRLHNMRTLSVMPEWKQRRTAQQTLDIYAPLAHRLGIQEIKWQLEDLAFTTLHPKRYAEIEQMVASRAPQRDEYLARVLVAAAGAAGCVRASPPRSPDGRSTSGASTRRWSCGARSSTTSTTWSASGSSSSRRRTAGPPSARSMPSGRRSRAGSRTTSTPRSSTSTSRCTPR